MIDKDPTAWELSTWLLAIAMPVAGGIVSWYSKVKQRKTRAFNIVELIGETFTSGFVGLGIFMTAQSLEYPVGICAAASGVGGHMATRLLFLFESIIESKLKDIEDRINVTNK